MMEVIQVSTLEIRIIGSLLLLLLGIISVFLNRLLGQFDTLNETVKKIDKDLSGDIGILKTENATMKTRITDLDPLWDRVRVVETDVAAIKGKIGQ